MLNNLRLRLIVCRFTPIDDFVVVGPALIFDEPGGTGVVKITVFEGA